MPDPTPKKKLPTDVRALARAYTENNIQVLGGYVNGENVDPDIRLRAIAMLLDRGWGKPQTDNNHTISGEVRVILRKMLEDEGEGEGEGEGESE